MRISGGVADAVRRNRWTGVVLMMLACVGIASAKDVITGIRTWKFTDGTELRAGLRSVKDGSAVLGVKKSNSPIGFEKFVPEHRDILEKVASGEIELLDDPRSGMGNTLSAGSGSTEWVLVHSAIGRERIWTKKDGKTAKGSLVNITDDEIDLLIGNIIWKMKVSDLGDADLAYLDGINRGTEEVVPGRINLPFSLPGPGKQEGHVDLWIGGARFMDSRPSMTFEDALAKAKEEISSKLASTAWKLSEVMDMKVGTSEYLEKRIAGYPSGKFRSCYQVRFTISERKISDARRFFPDNVDSVGRCYFVYFDDGLPPEQKFIPKETK